MKLKFSFILSLVLAGAACHTVGGGAPPPADAGDAQRLVGILDYVGGDYGRAVVDGRVANPSEYEEQRRFLADARSLVLELVPGAAAGEPLLAQLAALEKSVAERAHADEVLLASRELREAVVRRFALRVTPTARPQLARAVSLYAQNCAACHGERGDAETERARSLDPPPARFKDPTRLLTLSPHRVYNTLTFGVPGTAMASFETLTPEERWDLAFFVFRLAHLGGTQREAARPLAELAGLSNGELLESLRRSGTGEPETALTYLRVEEPFRLPAAGAGARHAEQLVAQAVSAFVAGKKSDAERRAIDAYLEGFEPLEAQLQARAPGSVARVEQAFGALRAALARDDTEAVRARGAELQALLFTIAEGEGQRSIPFVAALIIFFRECIEAALLVAALLATLRKLGRPEVARYVHLGWLLAVPAGFVTWWLFERALAWGFERRELLEAAISLFAAAVLFTVSFWFFSRAESQRWLSYLRQQVESTLTRRRLLLLAGVSFLAVFREAAETVLFTAALLLRSPGQEAQVAAGAAAGLGLAAAAAFVMNRTVRRLPVGLFFAVSGGLLTLLAISFAGAGAHGLVQAGYLSARPLPFAFPELPFLGLHPDWSGLLVQLGIATAAAGAALHGQRRARSAPA